MLFPTRWDSGHSSLISWLLLVSFACFFVFPHGFCLKYAAVCVCLLLGLKVVPSRYCLGVTLWNPISETLNTIEDSILPLQAPACMLSSSIWPNLAGKTSCEFCPLQARSPSSQESSPIVFYGPWQNTSVSGRNQMLGLAQTWRTFPGRKRSTTSAQLQGLLPPNFPPSELLGIHSSSMFLIKWLNLFAFLFVTKPFLNLFAF